jgi:SAM-dependent methyltransferase
MKRSLFEKAYHFIKGIALKKNKLLINSQQPDKGSILDIGGTGDFGGGKRDGWKTVGVEPSDKARAIALKSSFFVEDTSIRKSLFDVITMWHVLEHVPNLYEQIKELKRLLKPSGTLIVAVPNFKSFDAKHYGTFGQLMTCQSILQLFKKR